MLTEQERNEVLAAAGLRPEDLERHAAEVQQGRAAAAEVLPGPLLAAFAIREVEAAGLKLRPVVASDHVILRTLENPLLANLSAGETVRPSTEVEVWEAVYLFTVPVQQARAELARGREVYRECASRAIGDRFHAVTVGELAKRVVSHYIESWSTHLGYRGKAAEGENFPLPT